MIWSTDARSYRPCPDDGSMSGLLLGPLLATTMLFASLDDSILTPWRQRSPNQEGLASPPWYIEEPIEVLGIRNRQAFIKATPLTALALSRCTLVSLQTLISLILLIHLVVTRWFSSLQTRAAKSNWGRLGSYIAFSSAVTVGLFTIREVMDFFGLPVWTGLARWEVITASISFQTNMYTISRLGRGSFTLGELGIVAALGVTLMIETINLTLARVSRSSLHVISAHADSSFSSSHLLPLSPHTRSSFPIRPSSSRRFAVRHRSSSSNSPLSSEPSSSDSYSLHSSTSHDTSLKSRYTVSDGLTRGTCIVVSSPLPSTSLQRHTWWVPSASGYVGSLAVVILGSGPHTSSSKARGGGRGRLSSSTGSCGSRPASLAGRQSSRRPRDFDRGHQMPLQASSRRHLTLLPMPLRYRRIPLRAAPKPSSRGATPHLPSPQRQTSLQSSAVQPTTTSVSTPAASFSTPSPWFSTPPRLPLTQHSRTSPSPWHSPSSHLQSTSATTRSTRLEHPFTSSCRNSPITRTLVR